jgi:hypothetical protein
MFVGQILFLSNHHYYHESQYFSWLNPEKDPFFFGEISPKNPYTLWLCQNSY